MRIAVISHSLGQSHPQDRWRYLADEYKHEVNLIVPKAWRSNWFGKEVIWRAKPTNEGRFKIHAFNVTDNRVWGRYFFRSFDIGFKKIKPELIFIIHEELIWVHLQIYLYRFLWARRAKIVFFTMNGRGVQVKKSPGIKRYFWLRDRAGEIFRGIQWWFTKLNANAAIGHYPGCLNSLRAAGFDKPIFLQTQVGVDPKVFKMNKDVRGQMRERLGLEGKFVIGFCGRLVFEKGIWDLITVFPDLSEDCVLLIVGDGRLKDQILSIAQEKGWIDRLVMVGMQHQDAVADFMNAMDVFFLGSRSTPLWIDTFPLVTVQAQMVRVPVVASDSASIPWQLANTGLLFKEGDLHEIREALMLLRSNKGLRENLAYSGYRRANKLWSTHALAKNFSVIAEQIYSGDFHFHGPEEMYDQIKAFR